MSPSQLRALATLLSLGLVVACNDDGDGGNEPTADVAVDTADAASDAVEDTARLDVSVRDTTDDVTDGACEKEDRFTPNHGPAEAAAVEGGLLDETNLYVCANTDDWFRIDANAGQRITASITFAHRIGDLDLYLLPEGTEDLDDAVAVSGTEDDEESLEFIAPEDGTWFLVVDSFEGAVGSYDVTIAVSCRTDGDCPADYACSFIESQCMPTFEPTCGADEFETNDAASSASIVEVAGDGFAYLHGLTVCEEDDDYFSLTLDAPASVYLDLAFDPGFNLDLYVFSPDGDLFAAADADDENPEELVLPILPAGVYILAVDHFVTQLGADVGYNLTVEVRAARCESNADCGVGGRALCEEGGCVSYEPETPNPAGGACDDGTDCAGDLGCYQGNDGFDDNFCSRECEGNDDCADFEGGYCLPLGRDGVCFGTCEADTQCPTYYSCDDGRCRLDECLLDADCGDGQRCRRSEQQNDGYCTSAPFPACGDDDALEDNDTDGEAVAIDDDVDGVVCDGDDDWFAITVDEDGTRLDVSVGFDPGVDVDVFVFDAAGHVVAEGTEPNANPERAAARYLEAGTYLVRVNQYPGDSDQDTGYTLSYELSDDACAPDGDECLGLEPLRVLCDADTGACGFIEGEGTVPPGGACDSSDDCDNQSAFCWTFEGADEGRNVCSDRCNEDSDCEDAPGTSCVAFRNGFAACLPPAE